MNGPATREARLPTGADLASLDLDLTIGPAVAIGAWVEVEPYDDMGAVVALVIGNIGVTIQCNAMADEWATIHRRIGEVLTAAGVDLSGGAA